MYIPYIFVITKYTNETIDMRKTNGLYYLFFKVTVSFIVSYRNFFMQSSFFTNSSWYYWNYNTLHSVTVNFKIWIHFSDLKKIKGPILRPFSSTPILLELYFRADISIYESRVLKVEQFYYTVIHFSFRDKICTFLRSSYEITMSPYL
jgi:hypothetical protein